MMKRIVLIFFVLAALIVPASAATKSHRHKHTSARSRKSKSKSKAVRKSAHHRKKLAKR
jgi:hypothetical protein